MNTAPPDLSLYDALLQSGRLSADQRAQVERLFREFAADPGRLADELLNAKLVTKYMHRKIQTGRAGELVFGQYLILERIGEGGMGKVYRAVQTRMGREVALKTIRPNLLTNRTVVARYKREARAAGALDHVNIVKLFESDDVGGRYYLAMEFVDGSDLSRLIKDLNKEKAAMPPGEAAEYIRQAALGLQHAHDKGLVHRDIKPSNLLVSGERAIPGTGGKANVKILDMGLVRSLTDDDASTTDLTRDGTVVGTPDYMSPEQSRNSSTVDARADIYSLGCTLFYLLRGSPPYDSGTAIDKLIKHQLDPVPDIRQYRPDVPPRLGAVIKKMMAKRPDDRFQTADEVARELALFTGDPKVDVHSLPALVGELDSIPALQALEATPAVASAVQFDFNPAASTPAPAASATAPNAPNAQAVPLPAAPVLANESGLRSVARPVARPAKQSGTQPAPASGPQPSQRSVRILAVQARPIPKPPADATPSGDVETPTRSRRATAADSGPPSSPRRPTRRPPPKKPKGGFPVVAVAAAGVGVVALLVVLAVVLALSAKNDKPAPPTSAPPPPPAPQARAAFRPVAELLPDDTAAVLVGDPKAFWEIAQNGPDAPSVAARRYADALARWFKFDPRKFDRVTVAFHPDVSKCVAAGEGEVLKGEAFRKDLDHLPWAEAEPGPNGAVLVRTRKDPKANPFNPDRRVRAVLLPAAAAYLIGSDKADLTDLAKHADTRKGPAGVDPLFLAAVTETAGSPPNTPLAFFAASGKCRLPLKAKGTPEPLSTAGVELFTVRLANLDGQQARVTVTLLGKDAQQLNRFAERELTAMLETLVGRELAKPLADPLIEACQSTLATDAPDGRKQLSVTFNWPWTVVHHAADKLLPTPSDR